MPPENLGRDESKSNVYSVMLILACVFTIVALWCCIAELKSQYGMFGGRGAAAAHHGADPHDDDYDEDDEIIE